MYADQAATGIRVGTLLADTWRIERRIGTGGMAAVYAARHERNGCRVAVKVLHPDASAEADTVRRFRREGYLGNSINHRGVVRVYDDGVTTDGCAFLIMDLLEGRTLEDECEANGGRLPINRAISVVRDVLGILAASHEGGVIHRDVKPANVFVTNDGEVKLLDFGIATMARSSTADSRTSTGAGWGTVLFMAPEQISGDGARGARVDVWATGVMLFKLVSGRYPFLAMNLLELAAAYRTRPPMLERLVPGFPVEIARVVDRALTCAPEQRWSDAAAMLAALDQAEADALRETAEHRVPAAWSSSMTVALATVPRLPLAAPIAPPRGPVAETPKAPVQPMAPVTERALAETARRPFVLGFLALSIATFLTSAAYGVSVHGGPSATGPVPNIVVGSSR
jgi:serine/threonine-protein kinase